MDLNARYTLTEKGWDAWDAEKTRRVAAGEVGHVPSFRRNAFTWDSMSIPSTDTRPSLRTRLTAFLRGLAGVPSTP